MEALGNDHPVYVDEGISRKMVRIRRIKQLDGGMITGVDDGRTMDGHVGMLTGNVSFENIF